MKPPVATVAGTSSAQRARSVSPPAPPPSVSVNIVQVKGVEPTDIQIPPTMMKRLGLRSGSIVQLKSQDSVGWFEAIVGLQLSGSAVGLSDQSAAILVQSKAELEPLTDAVKAAPRVSLSCRLQDGSAPADDEQLVALFRRKMQRRLVFSGLVVLVNAAAKGHYLEVTSCGDGDSSFGVLVDSTVLTCTCVRDADVTNAPATSPTPPPAVVSTLLLIGEPGTGKSFCLRQLAQEHAALGRHVESIQLQELAHDNSSVTSATFLRRIFSKCSDSSEVSPVTLLIDDLHMICGTGAAESAAGSKWATLHMESVFRECLEKAKISLQQKTISIIATTVPDKLQQRLTSRFEEHRLLAPPTSPADRLLVLRRCLVENKVICDDTVQSHEGGVLELICNRAHGFNQRDLNSVCVMATIIAFGQRQSLKVGADDLLAASRQVRPSVLKGLEVSTAKVHWTDIGGSDEAKSILQDCVAWCLGRNRELFQKYNLSPPKGVLLYGPPGCSKTMLAKALATESNMNFISVKGPEVFSKWVGDSEKAVRDIFAKARLVMPCVVFIDELDGMCAHRGHGGVGDRVISQFLTELDGMPAALASTKSSIVVVAATNRPDSIDPAVLRPGRIDRKVYVGLPELAERTAIASIGLRNMPVASDVTAELLALRTVGYSGAEIISVCKEAAFDAIGESVEAQRIEMKHVEAGLAKVTPRITPMDVAWYLSWRGGRTAAAAVPFASSPVWGGGAK